MGCSLRAGDRSTTSKASFVEVFSAIWSSNEVFELLRRFNRERSTTFLVVTHDPRIARRCDRRIQLIDGRLTHLE